MSDSFLRSAYHGGLLSRGLNKYQSPSVPDAIEGVRQNGFDLRRCAVIHNLHVFASLTGRKQQAA
jgi:hypothetical protein